MSTPVTGPTNGHLDGQLFHDYLRRTRWFAGKGRTFEVTDVRAISEVPGRTEESPHVVIYLVEVTYEASPTTGTTDVELYQVPLSFYEHPEGRLDHAFVGWWEDPTYGWVHAYDALHDRKAMACWLRSFANAAGPSDAASDAEVSPEVGAEVGAEAGSEAGSEAEAGSVLTFHRLPGHDLDLTAHSTLFSGEQSNSSVAFGEDALMKVFRKVTPGVNPDIQIHEVLTNVGSQHVAPLYGWLDVVVPDESAEGATTMQLAMLQKFLRTATDGWDLALASVRTLFAEPEQHATDSGGDFAGEATRLGEAIRHVHTDLATHFPTEDRGPEAARELAATMQERLARAIEAVPELEQHHDVLQDIFRQAGELPSLSVQRVHGDLHLGQTLRTSVGWKIVDFEGEPAKPLGERLRPDSRWRDVAGMLRSFDYAPNAVIQGMTPGEETDQLRVRAVEWANRNRNFFLVAYAGGDLTAQERTLLAAYVADKAVYECVYESRNRPSWLEIPLSAIARIGAS